MFGNIVEPFLYKLYRKALAASAREVEYPVSKTGNARLRVLPE